MYQHTGIPLATIFTKTHKSLGMMNQILSEVSSCIAMQFSFCFH